MVSYIEWDRKILFSQVKSPDNLVDFLEIPLPISYNILQQEIIL